MNCLGGKDDDLHNMLDIMFYRNKCSVNIEHHNSTHDDDFKQWD